MKLCDLRKVLLLTLILKDRFISVQPQASRHPSMELLLHVVSFYANAKSEMKKRNGVIRINQLQSTWGLQFITLCVCVCSSAGETGWYLYFSAVRSNIWETDCVCDGGQESEEDGCWWFIRSGLRKSIIYLFWRTWFSQSDNYKYCVYDEFYFLLRPVCEGGSSTQW